MVSGRPLWAGPLYHVVRQPEALLPRSHRRNGIICMLRMYVA